MVKRRIVTLLSDFGLRDAYVAEIKAVILSICSSVTIIDISHEIRKFDVRMGAFVLAESTPYFPVGTVNLAVVDPGVGTRRRPVIVEARRNNYVGPDNGLLMLSAQREGIRHVYEITNPRLTLKPISTTFHGRDIFGPAAAYLASGVAPSEFGPEIHDPIIPSYADISIDKNRIVGEIVHVDDFGNLVTNLTTSHLAKIGIREEDTLLVTIGKSIFRLEFRVAYGEVMKGSPVAVIGSGGFLEVSTNQGNAAEILGIHVSERIIVESGES